MDGPATELKISITPNQDLPPSSNKASASIGSSVVTKAWPIMDENGEYVKDDGAMIYVTETGVQIRVVSADEDSQIAPLMENSENGGHTCWDDKRTKFLITSYKALKERAGRMGDFPTKKAMWKLLAEEINKEFGESLTSVQVANRWNTLRRAYKRAKGKNGTSGNSRMRLDHEEFRALHDILEKEYINSSSLVGPQQVHDNSESSDSADAERSDPGNVGNLQSGKNSAGLSSPRPHPSKRRKSSTSQDSFGDLLKKLDDIERARQRRHEEKMKLLGRLVTALEKAPNSPDT